MPRSADHISVTDLFSIGIGPSSSHTVGPMKAALHFARDAVSAARASGAEPSRVVVELYGSLGATGIGHGTDRAVQWGLSGYHPRTCPDGVIADLCPSISRSGTLVLCGELPVPFDPIAGISLLPRTILPQHVNGVLFRLESGHGGAPILERVYFSTGGGFVTMLDDGGGQIPVTVDPAPESAASPGGNGGGIGVLVPYPFTSGDTLLAACERTGLGVADLVRENELALRSPEELDAELDAIWGAMKECIESGMTGEGTLPGRLLVPRRAGKIYRALLDHGSAMTEAGPGAVATLEEDGVAVDPLFVMDWVNLYALAVNEENASGHRVVTAPTNGAAGVIPAVLAYYMRFRGGDAAGVRRFLLAATAIGTIVKLNASIAGAEVGCQGEVGSASAMAAAGLAEVMGGTPAQVENAAEIAMEHNLGLTCDPIGGLVQIPCIERNAVAAVKALNAARLAMWGDGTHTVSLDAVVETMRQTGMDMMSKYKETSEGGLAVNVVEC
ncbi:MAG TPA: L-serine ammonia-lyase [Actinomycetaceae bacterium]|nr:L-serine ammonia-lyase [Actinomycetaceae bacterium]